MRARPRHRPRARSTAALALGIALIVNACADDRTGKTLDDPDFPLPVTTLVSTTLPPPTTPPAALTLVAPWVEGAEIPDRYTCAGDGVSPALTWSNVPVGTIELAVTVVDLDAGPLVHWIVFAIGNGETGLVEGQLPAGAFEWPNSFGDAAWQALCTPSGETHRYQFTIHALNQQLEVADDASATEVLSIVNATSIDLSSISGLSTGVG